MIRAGREATDAGREQPAGRESSTVRQSSRHLSRVVKRSRPACRQALDAHHADFLAAAAGPARQAGMSAGPHPGPLARRLPVPYRLPDSGIRTVHW